MKATLFTLAWTVALAVPVLVIGFAADALLQPAAAERLGEAVGPLFVYAWLAGAAAVWLVAYFRRDGPSA